MYEDDKYTFNILGETSIEINKDGVFFDNYGKLIPCSGVSSTHKFNSYAVVDNENVYIVLHVAP